MSTVNTTHRNYIWPLKDEDLEASNTIIKSSFDMVDEDIHQLFSEKADVVDTIGEATVDTKISAAVNSIDIYGTYSGDVVTDITDNKVLNLKDVLTTPGTYTKITVNSKGLVTFGDQAQISDLGGFNIQDYLLNTDIQDSFISNSTLWSSSKIDGKFNNYVLLTNFSDSDILTKIKNVDGIGSGLDSDQLDGQDGSYYLDFVNTTNKPTTISGYGISDAYTKTEVDAISTGIASASSYGIKFSVTDIPARDALTEAVENDLVVVQSNRIVYRMESSVWVLFFGLDEVHTHSFASMTSKPTTITGYGITDAYTKTEVDSKIDISGLTAARPSSPSDGMSFFDMTLKLPIWFDGTNWIDASGTIV